MSSQQCKPDFQKHQQENPDGLSKWFLESVLLINAIIVAVFIVS